MKSKHIPIRTCAGCGGKFEKSTLIRIVKNKSGELHVDKTGKADGRGAYICDSAACLEKLIKNKRLSREFEMQIPAEIYDSLREEFSGEKE